VKFPELLAPAGNIASFYAAIKAGADAVYIGLKQFSARRRAENFTLEQFKKAVRFAHENGKKVYAVINTVIKESETDELLNVVAELEDCYTDAIIFADPIFLTLRSRIHIPLHASTQMHISNAGEVNFMKRMGVDRVILERQLSIEEILRIRKSTDVELEIFVDGALCYSISGLCFFSSFLGGKSANRGLCTQVCRRNFQSKNGYGSIFSMSDLMAIDILDKIVRIGINCIKIEGRMKSAEAVYEVTKGYRDALDDIKAGRFDSQKEYFDRYIGHRSSTTRLFLEKGSKNIIDAGTSFVGRKIGYVSDINVDKSLVKIDGMVKNGDRLRIPVKGGNENVTFRWFSGKLNNGYINIKRNDILKLKKGMPVFLHSSAKSTELETISSEVFSNIQTDKPIDLEIKIDSSLMNVKLPLYGIESCYKVDVKPSERNIEEFLHKYLGRLGNSGYRLGNIDLIGLKNVFIRPSVLNGIRRDLLAKIAEKKKISIKIKPARASRRTGLPSAVFVITDDYKLLPFLKHNEQVISSKIVRAKADIIFMPELPVLFEKEANRCRKSVGRAYITDLSWFPFIQAEYKISGYAVYAYNHISFNFLIKYFNLVTLFIESSYEDLKNISEKIDCSKALIYFYGKPNLFTSRVIQKTNRAKSSRNEEFQLKNDALSLVRPAKPFSWIGNRKKLEQLGYRNFMLDLRGLSTLEARDLLRLYYEDKLVAGSYGFNWNRFVE